VRLNTNCGIMKHCARLLRRCKATGETRGAAFYVFFFFLHAR